MKCPYIIAKTQTVNQEHYEYDEDGQLVVVSRIENILSDMAECCEKDCAVWKNGECMYNGRYKC